MAAGQRLRERGQMDRRPEIAVHNPNEYFFPKKISKKILRFKKTFASLQRIKKHGK